VYFELLYPL